MDVEAVVMRQRNSKNSRTENLRIVSERQENYIKGRLEAEKEQKLIRHNQEMDLLKKVISRIKQSKKGCTNCNRKSVRTLRKRIKDLRKELGMKLFGIPGREFQ